MTCIPLPRSGLRSFPSLVGLVKVTLVRVKVRKTDKANQRQSGVDHVLACQVPYNTVGVRH